MARGRLAPKAKDWSWDIEALEWDRPRCVVAISSDGDLERFAGPGCLERMGDVIERTRGTWVAHAGGIYDTLLYSQIREKLWQELIMSGSAVLCAVDGNLRMRDSFRWWLSGLKKVGEYLEKKENERPGGRRFPVGHWLKKDVDRSRMHLLSDEETLAYCESDTSILMEGIVQAREYATARGAVPKWTAGSSALSLLEQLEPASWRTLARHALDLETATAASACVRGARVENWAQGRVPVVYVYDFKSAYPASYADLPLGIGARKLGPLDDDCPGAVWRIRWFWPWRNVIPPILDQITGAGAGWCEAWAVEDEIRILEDLDVKYQRVEGWAPAQMFPLGQVFARDLYNEKEQGSFFGKVYLNSLHGKYSESPLKTTWTRDKPTDYYGRPPELVAGSYWRGVKADVDAAGMCRRHVQPLAGAHILGRARAKLYKAIAAVVEAGGEVYYCDTDSVHCNLPPEKMPMELGTGMGALAFEGGPFEGIYVASKAYCLIPHDPALRAKAKIKGALKGMPWNAMVDGICQEDGPRGAPLFRQARGDEKGSDLRVEVFERALTEPRGVELLKEGITSFGTGLRRKAGWTREEMPRTLRPVNGGKSWQQGGSATAWGYLTPMERLLRGARTPAFTESPYEENVAEQGVFDMWIENR